MCKGPGIYTRWNITSQGENAHVRFETNDDNDDGFPDGHVTVDEFEATLKVALNIAGKTRTGCYGHLVEVFLDGQKI